MYVFQCSLCKTRWLYKDTYCPTCGYGIVYKKKIDSDDLVEQIKQEQADRLEQAKKDGRRSE